MPKNYQISQYDLPVCVGGHLDVELPDGSTTKVGITRVHMEEDTGKTAHGSASGRIHEAESALIDYNRAGVPLVECVSEPDMRSPEEAGAYLRELRALLGSLDVSDVRMEEGSLRCDANMSVRPVGTDALGVKVEIKNMNSVRSLERALVFEAARQIAALEAGEPLVQETRDWDEDSGTTKTMRSKEEAFDYRYFPEPDIPALEPDEAWIEEIRRGLPELPRARRARYVDVLGLKPEVARVLVADREATDACSRRLSRSAPSRRRRPTGSRRTWRVCETRRSWPTRLPTPPSDRSTSRTWSPSSRTARSGAPGRSGRSRKRSGPERRSRTSSRSEGSGRSRTRASWAPSWIGCSRRTWTRPRSSAPATRA